MKTRWQKFRQMQIDAGVLEARAAHELKIMQDDMDHLWLKKGSMNPAEVVIIDVSGHDRVRVQRVDNDRVYWVYTCHLSKARP
jgi:hypothetical protein